MKHDIIIQQLEDLLLMNNYQYTFTEPFGEGERTLYRNGASDIFIEHVKHGSHSEDLDNDY